MFSMHLFCQPEEIESISFQLWEAGTVGIREEQLSTRIELIAAFEDTPDFDSISSGLAGYQHFWDEEEKTDWVEATHEAWPAREIGQRLFLAPVWNADETPNGRLRVIHNPGMASGTGEHPCTQLALESLELCVTEGNVVVDVGTGSGILATAARHLGARVVVALDMDFPSLDTARENFELNKFAAPLVMGSADCIAPELADVVVANISGTVLMSISDELLRIVKAGGSLILTGFPESELSALKAMFGAGSVTEMNEWRCLTLRM